MELLHFKAENEDINPYLNWWITATQKEKHMVSLSDDFKTQILYAVIAVHQGQPIGAAAIVPARTFQNDLIQFNSRLVVELGSNYVEPNFRRQGLAKIFVETRINFAKLNNWFAVSVTTNPNVQDLFIKVGGKPINEEEEFIDLKKHLCMCRNGPNKCDFCPFTQNAAWYFP